MGRQAAFHHLGRLTVPISDLVLFLGGGHFKEREDLTNNEMGF